MSWIIQKGMRTRFNHGDWREGLLVVDFGIAVVMGLISPRISEVIID